MDQEAKAPAEVKADVITLMKEHVYGGDFENPRQEMDAAGFYHYKDDKIQIALAISPRDGWLSCSIDVAVLRRGWIRKKPEVVFATGFGYDVSVFRPGLWCDYIKGLADNARGVEKDRGESKPTADTEPDPKFTPVDDADIFRK